MYAMRSMHMMWSIHVMRSMHACKRCDRCRSIHVMRSMHSCMRCDRCIWCDRHMWCDRCMHVSDAIDADQCMRCDRCMHVCDAIDAYDAIMWCVWCISSHSYLLCINAIVGSARLLRHDTPGHESDAQEDAQEARRKLGKWATSLGCDVLLCTVPLKQSEGSVKRDRYLCLLTDPDLPDPSSSQVVSNSPYWSSSPHWSSSMSNPTPLKDQVPLFFLTDNVLLLLPTSVVTTKATFVKFYNVINYLSFYVKFCNAVKVYKKREVFRLLPFPVW